MFAASPDCSVSIERPVSRYDKASLLDIDGCEVIVTKGCAIVPRTLTATVMSASLILRSATMSSTGSLSGESLNVSVPLVMRTS